MRWKHRISIGLLAAAFLAGVVVLYRITPEKTWWMPPCVFHKFTGLHCPGCGTARGLHKLLHGDLLGALRMNALMVALIPVMAYLLLTATRPEKGKPLPKWLPWTILAATAVFWVARNIPAYPFTLLAPH